MLPPRYTKSVTVTAVDSNYTICALYSTNKEEEEQWDKVELAQGESHTFEKKIEDMGTWTAVRKIISIK